MPSANRCPQCRSTIHPFAATCENCGADLDAHRRRMVDSAGRRPSLTLPRPGREMTDVVIGTVILLLLALFAPLFGVLFGLLVVAYGQRSGQLLRRNLAIACTALAFLDLVAPTLLATHLIV